MSGLFEWMIVFNSVVFVILLTLPMLIRIAFRVLRFVFLRRAGFEAF